MISVGVRTRVVVVLSHRIGDSAAFGFIDRAARCDIPLVILSVGYPQSSAQQRFIGDAVHHAFGANVHLDAILVSDASALPGHIEPGDDVSVVASGRQGRRIAASLAP